MNPNDVLKYIDSSYVQSLSQQLVRIPTESPGENERSKDRTPIIELIHEHLEALGLKPGLLTVIKERPNIIAEIAGSAEGPTLLLYSHSDTIEVTEDHREIWICDPFGGEVRDGKLHGIGSADTKGGLASVVGAVKAIIESGIKFRGKIILLFSTAGEGGAPGGHVTLLKHNLMPKADGAILADSSDLKIVRTFKGRVWFEFIVHGKSAHASDPKLGINAVDKMYDVVRALKKLKFTGKGESDLGDATFTVTGIEAINPITTVPAKCRLTVDMRLIPGVTPEKVAKKIEGTLKRLMKKDNELNVSMKTLPNSIKKATLTPMENSIVQATAKAMEDVVGEAEFLPGTMSTGASYFLEAGIPCVFFGPGAITNAHMPNEYVDLPQIEKATKIYALAALNFLGIADRTVR